MRQYGRLSYSDSLVSYEILPHCHGIVKVYVFDNSSNMIGDVNFLH